MSKAFAARSPSVYRSWWTATAIASAIELGSLRLFAVLIEGDDHSFLACVLFLDRVHYIVLGFAELVGPFRSTGRRHAMI